MTTYLKQRTERMIAHLESGEKPYTYRRVGLLLPMYAICFEGNEVRRFTHADESDIIDFVFLLNTAYELGGGGKM